MDVKNTTERYGSVSLWLHWVMALLIIAMLTAGLVMTEMENSPLRGQIYWLHKSTGVLILFLMLLRIAWRLINAVPSLSSLPAWERISARTVHWLFYILLVLMPLFGWLMSSAADRRVSFYGLFTLPALVAPNEAMAGFYSQGHTIIGYSIIVLICIHTLAAIKHHWIDKNNIMRRMWW